MSSKDRNIENVRNELFKSGLVRLSWSGAVLVLVAGLAGRPHGGQSAVILSVIAAVVLAAIGLLSRNSRGRNISFHRVLGLAAIATASGCLAILMAGGSGPGPALIAGQVLLIIAVLGFLPASVPFYAAAAGLLCVLFLTPPVLSGTLVTDWTAALSNGVAAPVIAVAVAFRLLNDRSLRHQLSRSVDLPGPTALYQDIFRQAPEPLFIFDAHLRFVDGNGPALAVLRYLHDELRQMRLNDLLPPDQVSRMREELPLLGSGGKAVVCECKIRTKSGRWLDGEVRPFRTEQNGDPGLRWYLVRDVTERRATQETLDRYRRELERNVLERTMKLRALNSALEREVTERRKAEERIIKQLDRQRALSTVERAIASSLDPGQTLNIFIDQVMGQLETDAAAVMLYDHVNQELAFAAARGFRSNRIMKVRVKAGRSLAGTVIARRTKIAIADMEHPEARYPSAEGYDFRNSFMVKDEGFRSYIGVPLTVKGVVKGTLEVFHRKVFEPGEDWLEFLDALSQQASIAIDNAEMYAALRRSHAEISLAYDKTIEGWSRALDIRDNETHGHSQRVAELTVRLARRLGIAGEELSSMRRGALLHDIGKLGVPDSILRKPGRLTGEEMAVMKRHPEIAFDILAPIPFLKDSLDIPYLHHEKWDGTGYPRGLRGEDIPVAARIFSVIDVWDALRSDRPYRPAWGEDRVREYLASERSRHFDPLIVDHFLQEVPSDAHQ